MKKYIFVLFSLFLVACGDGTSAGVRFVNMLTLKDCRPPVIEQLETVDPYCARIVFDEIVLPVENAFDDCRVESSGAVLDIVFSQPLSAGTNRTVRGAVKDRYGNTLTFGVAVWGINESPAHLVINELTTKGSKTQPDRTELKVKGAGNLAGITVYDGVPDSYRNAVILPDTEAENGSFVVIWWCDELPQGVKGSEAGVKNIAAGGGLSDNNGIICIASSPMQDAQVTDCIVWTNGESSQYEGYGTKEVYLRVSEAREKGWWNGNPVYSGNSTSTRAMARSDTGDWYTTVQGGITFGKPNTSAAYTGAN